MATTDTNELTLEAAWRRGREIGPIGTASRVVAGVAAFVFVVWDGVGWWDLPALLAAPLVAAVAARLILLTSGRSAGSSASCVLVGALFAAAFALGEATAVDGDVVFWGFVGASMLFGAARGDAGCELLAIPNAITGRRDRIGCILFNPIDAAEARRGRGQVAGQGVR